MDIIEWWNPRISPDYVNDELYRVPDGTPIAAGSYSFYYPTPSIYELNFYATGWNQVIGAINRRILRYNELFEYPGGPVTLSYLSPDEQITAAKLASIYTTITDLRALEGFEEVITFPPISSGEVMNGTNIKNARKALSASGKLNTFKQGVYGYSKTYHYRYTAIDDPYNTRQSLAITGVPGNANISAGKDMVGFTRMSRGRYICGFNIPDWIPAIGYGTSFDSYLDYTAGRSSLYQEPFTLSLYWNTSIPASPVESDFQQTPPGDITILSTDLTSGGADFSQNIALGTSLWPFSPGSRHSILLATDEEQAGSGGATNESRAWLNGDMNVRFEFG